MNTFQTPSPEERQATLSAGERIVVNVNGSEWLFFQTVPAGVKVEINGGALIPIPQGFLHRGSGGGKFDRLEVVNTTGSDQTVSILYGIGDVNVLGSVTLIGTIPLPAGASTAANQATGNAHLATLATPVARSPKLRAIAGGASETIAACRWVEWFNKSTTENMTVTISGEAAYTVGPREGGGLPMLHPRESSYPQIVVACAAAGSGVVSFIV